MTGLRDLFDVAEHPLAVRLHRPWLSTKDAAYLLEVDIGGTEHGRLLYALYNLATTMATCIRPIASDPLSVCAIWELCSDRVIESLDVFDRQGNLLEQTAMDDEKEIGITVRLADNGGVIVDVTREWTEPTEGFRSRYGGPRTTWTHAQFDEWKKLEALSDPVEQASSTTNAFASMEDATAFIAGVVGKPQNFEPITAEELGLLDKSDSTIGGGSDDAGS